VYERTHAHLAPEAYRQAREQIGALVRDAPGATVVPACPAWTVADLTAHLAGTAVALLVRSLPGDDPDGWVAGHVAERRGRAATANVEEWQRAGEDYERLLAKNESAWGALAYDAVAHEHDLREALAMPGNRTGPGVDYAVDRALATLERDAIAHGVGSVAVAAGAERWALGDGDVTVTVEAADRWELLRLLGCRRSERQVRAAVSAGDPEALLATMHWALPATDRLG